MSARVMAYTVVVRHPDTDAPTALLAGKPVPGWATGLVQDDDLLNADEPAQAAPVGVVDVEPAPAEGQPPRAGRGSGLEAWTEYAQGLGIEVPEDASRDDVVELVDAHSAT